MPLSVQPGRLSVAVAPAGVRAMTGNLWFPSPDPPLVPVEAAIDALAAADESTA